MRPDKHILVVDDDEALRELLKLLLTAEGYRVGGAANGREALGYLRQTKPPSLILLDLSMPVMNGWQFRQEQKNDPALALIPVVVLSGEADLPRVATSLGVAAHFSKPVEIAELLDALGVIDTKARATLPRPGEKVRWRQPEHAHALGWAFALGTGPFEVVRVVDKSEPGIPAAAVLKTNLGEREVNTVWLAPYSDTSRQSYDLDTLTALLDGLERA